MHCIIESENLVYGTMNRNFPIIWRDWRAKNQSQLGNHNTALTIKLYCDFLSPCTRPLQCGEQKFARLLQLLTKYCITLIDNNLYFQIVTFYLFWNFNSGHPREPREAVEASKMIIGHTQNINPDKDGVCSCPICPKGM